VEQSSVIVEKITQDKYEPILVST